LTEKLLIFIRNNAIIAPFGCAHELFFQYMVAKEIFVNRYEE